MGFYINEDDIYGIIIYHSTNAIRVLYRKTYDQKMNDSELRETYIFYNDLIDKNDIGFSIYTPCCCTLDVGKDSMIWYPIELDTFITKMNV